MQKNRFITDPFLQNPTATTVSVVWFTSFEGTQHYVNYGSELKFRAPASSKKMRRLQRKEGPIWRHEAVLENLVQGNKIPYQVVSLNKDEILQSPCYSCSTKPNASSSLKILLTSDHQNKPMVAANLQKAQEIAGHFDAVFFAGDCAEIPDDAYSWFDHQEGSGFFPCLQGKASQVWQGKTYHGAPILQETPIYPCLGNHEYMGIFDPQYPLEYQFNHPRPRKIAENIVEQSLTEKEHGTAIKDLSFNHITYDEIFTLPKNSKNTNDYYSIYFGDIALIVLNAVRVWRSPDIDQPKKGRKNGKYQEAKENISDPLKWGWGDFIFEPIDHTSEQYLWLKHELQSESFQTSRYKIVMLHHPLHTLGENAIPPFTDPIQKILTDDAGNPTDVSYSYPKDKDYLIRDIEPLFEEYGVHLVLCGHSHVWNRFQSPQGIHYLETSHVGNTYGAYLKKERTTDPFGHHALTGDPYGLTPITPNIAPLKDSQENWLPYIAHDSLTVFSIFETSSGAIESYYYDLLQPESEPILFDRFYIGNLSKHQKKESNQTSKVNLIKK
ncbi:MAG: metallophosphoesterase [Chlamydiales bacterium]